MAQYSRHAEALEDTRREILAERAAALKRITEGLETRLDELEDLAQRIERAPEPERPRRIAEFNERRHEARRWLWYLTVQREANGLREHSAVEERYEIPPPL